MNDDAALRALQERIDRLEDEAALVELLSEYAATMDGQNLDGFPSLFTDDVVIEHPRGKNAGLEDVVTTLRAAVGGHFTSHHMITNQRFVLNGDTARGVAYFHSVHLDDEQHPDQHDDHGGWYLFRFARQRDGWRIDSLKQVSVWSAGNRRPGGPLERSILRELRDHLGGEHAMPG